MAHRERSSLRTISLASLVLIGLYYLGLFGGQPLETDENNKVPLQEQSVLVEKINRNSLFLTQKECVHAFPGLTKEIEDRIASGPFELQRADNYMGLAQGRVKDGNLYIITTSDDSAIEKFQYRSAALHQLHRAIITSPEPLPDITFALCVNDYPRNNSWSFARWDSPDTNNWLMPHFSFWSWPLSFIGTIDEVLEKVDRIERKVKWEQKINKVVWRGTPWYNPIGNKALRSTLLKVTAGKEWANVEALKWDSGGKEAQNALLIEDFCKYKYIIYTEGITYSGRLHYHQACTSIIITPPPTFLVHTTHLMKPVFSSSLPLSQPPVPYRQDRTSINRTWPHEYSPDAANVVFVSPDWSDLEATIEWLEKNPKVAEGIARRSRKELVEGGYLSGAAEVCYWRELMRGWNKVARINEADWPEEGTRWETFVLKDKV